MRAKVKDRGLRWRVEDPTRATTRRFRYRTPGGIDMERIVLEPLAGLVLIVVQGAPLRTCDCSENEIAPCGWVNSTLEPTLLNGTIWLLAVWAWANPSPKSKKRIIGNTGTALALQIFIKKICLRPWPVSRVQILDLEQKRKNLRIKGLDYLEVLRHRLGCKKADKFPRSRKAQGE